MEGKRTGGGAQRRKVSNGWLETATFLSMTDTYVHTYFMGIEPQFRALHYCARQQNYM